MTRIARSALFLGLVAAVLAPLPVLPAGAVPAPVAPAPHASLSRPTATVSTATVRTRDGRRALLVSTPSTWSQRHRGAIVVLHGAQSSVSAMQRVSALDAEATRAGLAVVDLVALPAATTGWNAGSCCFAASARGVDDVGYVAAAVAWIRSTWRLDASAITIVGYSNGGMLGYRSVCERPGLVGRLVVVAGARLVPCAAASRPTALLHVHGDADTTVPVGGTRWQAWLHASVPSARSSVAGLGVRDRCTSWVTRTSSGTTVTDGVGCRATVRLVVVHGLTHRWTRSPRVDETALAVAFALGSSR